MPPNSDCTPTSAPLKPQDWKSLVAEYQKSSTGRALWQVANTFIPYAILWVLMYYSLAISYWIAIPLALLAGAFLIRNFIIFHDCGHGSFFKSQRANDTLGFITGLLTFTPYHQWRADHAQHHSAAGDLDRRGTGDVWTLTVQEYLESSRWKKFSYRLARNPIVLFGLAPLFLFLVIHRFPTAKANTRERLSVHLMNLAILLMVIGMSSIFGFKAYAILQLTAMSVAAGTGVWMFYVQHQFEGVYWERGHEWDYTAAALEGSSFYKLPKVLQWFSGNIGFHHIHHLSPRIPNYNLERCHEATPLFQKVKPITLLSSLKSIHLRLWDEQLKKLVTYAHLRELRKQQKQSVSS
jgi:acyl-lipid omega-6 desaturase (Delta-12 desaturase)